MSVQRALSRVPAASASSSLGRPVMRARLPPAAPAPVLASARSCLKAESRAAASSTPHLAATFFARSSSTVGAEPKLAAGSVRHSLSCESNVGFTTRQHSHTESCARICAALGGVTPLPARAAASAESRATRRSATRRTCVPPFGVAIEFTNDTCSKSSSLDAPTTSIHRSPRRCTTSGRFSPLVALWAGFSSLGSSAPAPAPSLGAKTARSPRHART